MLTPEKRETGKSRDKEKRPFQSGQLPDDDKSRLAVTVAVPREEAYKFFRDFQNLPFFMKDLKSIEVLSKTKSHWVVEVKGLTAEWDAEIIEERPGEFIAWRSVEGSQVETSGSLWFSPGPVDSSAVLSLTLDYKLPGGKITKLLTMMSGEDPKSLAFINLRRLKCYLETGEIATIEGQTDGRDADSEPSMKH